MRKCSEECIPCCDYCKYVIHKGLLENDEVLGAPIFCALHMDKEHTKLARGCGYCDDFWCMDSDKDIVAVELKKVKLNKED